MLTDELCRSRIDSLKRPIFIYINVLIMRDLLDLVQVVTRTKLKSVSQINLSNNGTSKVQEFYNLLSDGNIESDEQAADFFYDSEKQNASYQKLRKTLKDRLINSLFVIDLKKPSYTDRERAYYEACREWAATKILFGKQARTVAVSLSRKLLKIAQKFEFTELVTDINHTLRLYHGTVDGDRKKYQQYNQLFKKYQEIWNEENRVEELYLELSIESVNSKATKTEIQNFAVASYQKIKESLNKYDSYHIHLCGRLIEVSQYSSINDYENTLQVCNDAIEFFEKKKYVARVPLQIFFYQKLICHLQLRNFKEAKEAASYCEKYLEKGAFNWFKLKELMALVLMHSAEYKAARKLVDEMMLNEKFQTLPDNIQESWKISRAYIYYLEFIGHLPASEKTEKGFRLARFLNEMEIFTKDKKGMNIPILILDLVWNIANKEHDKLIDRVEGLEKYRSRYLRGEQTQRSNLFLKLLLHLPKNAFQKKIALKKAKKDFEALQSLPIEIANQTFEIEIIPYEKLWFMVLETI